MRKRTDFVLVVLGRDLWVRDFGASWLRISERIFGSGILGQAGCGLRVGFWGPGFGVERIADFESGLEEGSPWAAAVFGLGHYVTAGGSRFGTLFGRRHWMMVGGSQLEVSNCEVWKRTRTAYD